MPPSHAGGYAQLEHDMRRLERLVASMKRPEGVAGAGLVDPTRRTLYGLARADQFAYGESEEQPVDV